MRYMIYNRKGDIIGKAEISFRMHEIISGTGKSAAFDPPNKLTLQYILPLTTRTPAAVGPTVPNPVKQVVVNVQQRYRNGYNTYRPRLVSTNEADDKLISSVPLWSANV